MLVYLCSQKHEGMAKSIFDRLLEGEIIPFNDPDYGQVREACDETRNFSVKLNNAVDPTEIRRLLSEVTGKKIAESTTLFPPLFINYGKNTRIGERVFINHACSFLDLGGITIEDDVMIAPKVNLLSEGHPVSIKDRNSMVPGSIHIKKGAWIGAGATILAGVTVGENSIVAAGSIVSKDVPDNTVVAGAPSKVIKSITN